MAQTGNGPVGPNIPSLRPPLQNETERRAARRVKYLREHKGLTQAELSTRMEIASRQTLATIESGDRAFSAEEIASAAKALGVQPELLTDPFALVGEGQFNFRQDNADHGELVRFKSFAGSLVAFYRELGRRLGARTKPMGKTLQLTADSSFEDAQAAADLIREDFALGDAPGRHLEQTICTNFDVLVLNVDMPHRVSGAAVHLPGCHAILINRSEKVGRRSFDLAHELFHVLTWDRMAPKELEGTEPASTKGNRVEWLAQNFAAALLMPTSVLVTRWNQRSEQHLRTWATETANYFRVSPNALGWRLFNLGLLPRAEIDHLGADVKPSAPPLLFSLDFVERLRHGLEQGLVSERKAAELLSVPMASLSELLVSYDLKLAAA